MTTHLEGPWLNTTGKSKKGKTKHRNAAAAAKARTNDESWSNLKKKWNIDADQRKEKKAMITPPLKNYLQNPARRQTPEIKSLGSGIGVAAKKESKVYTGDKMLGIAAMHKSNLVPVFSHQEVEDIGKMRR
jgi:hypothetical protein